MQWFCRPAQATKSDAIILLDCITFKILSNVSESNDVIVLFYCILHQTSLNMLWKGGAMILQASPGLIAPSFKQVQTCMKLVSFMNIWKKLKLAIKLVKSCINLFELVQAQKGIYRAVLDSFWILFSTMSELCLIPNYLRELQGFLLSIFYHRLKEMH